MMVPAFQASAVLQRTGPLLEYVGQSGIDSATAVMQISTTSLAGVLDGATGGGSTWVASWLGTQYGVDLIDPSSRTFQAASVAGAIAITFAAPEVALATRFGLFNRGVSAGALLGERARAFKLASSRGMERLGGMFGRGRPAAGICHNCGIGIQESKLGHIFRDAPGHFGADTAANRALIQGAVDEANLVGTRNGVSIYRQLLSNGDQVWAKVFNGEITNAGLNTGSRVLP